MKKYILILSATLLTFSACTKNDPVPEVDQEELSSASLIFTPVEKIDTDGIISYVPIIGEDADTLKFIGKQLQVAPGSHLHLHVGETYKLELKTTDFNGNASEQSFVNRADTHQAFLLNAPEGTLDFVYGDDNVGVTAYITVKKEAKEVLRYVMRHLNKGVKANIKASDWSNLNFTNFTGANDLDLKFEVHFIDEDHGH